MTDYQALLACYDGSPASAATARRPSPRPACNHPGAVPVDPELQRRYPPPTRPSASLPALGPAL